MKSLIHNGTPVVLFSPLCRVFVRVSSECMGDESKMRIWADKVVKSRREAFAVLSLLLLWILTAIFRVILKDWVLNLSPSSCQLNLLLVLERYSMRFLRDNPSNSMFVFQFYGFPRVVVSSL